MRQRRVKFVRGSGSGSSRHVVSVVRVGAREVRESQRDTCERTFDQHRKSHGVCTSGATGESNPVDSEALVLGTVRIVTLRVRAATGKGQQMNHVINPDAVVGSLESHLIENDLAVAVCTVRPFDRQRGKNVHDRRTVPVVRATIRLTGRHGIRSEAAIARTISSARGPVRR
jgi:hypothetical protein